MSASAPTLGGPVAPSAPPKAKAKGRKRAAPVAKLKGQQQPLQKRRGQWQSSNPMWDKFFTPKAGTEALPLADAGPATPKRASSSWAPPSPECPSPLPEGQEFPASPAGSATAVSAAAAGETAVSLSPWAQEDPYSGSPLGPAVSPRAEVDAGRDQHPVAEVDQPEHLSGWISQILEAEAVEQDTSQVDNVVLKAFEMSKLESAQDAEQDPEVEATLEGWRAAAKTGSAVRATPPSNKFYRKLSSDPKFHEQYEQCRTLAAKKEFRRNFFGQELIVIEANKAASKSFRQVEETRGVMMTFGQVVVSLGGWGWTPAIKGAKLTALKCARMGGRWIKRDPWSELLLFRKLTESDSEIFTKSWEEFLKYQADAATGTDDGKFLGEVHADGGKGEGKGENSGQGEGQGTDGGKGEGKGENSGQGTGEGKDGDKGKGKGEELVKGKGKGKGKDGGKGKGQGQGHEKNGIGTEELKAMSTTKRLVDKVETTANRFIMQVESGALKFDWANSPKHIGKLKAGLQELHGLIKDDDRELLLLPWSDVKKNKTPQQLKAIVTRVCALHGSAEALEALMAKITDLHRRENHEAKPRSSSSRAGLP